MMFPGELCLRQEKKAGVGGCHEQLSSGARSLLGLPIYDFALYINKGHLQKSAVGTKYSDRVLEESLERGGFTADLVRANEVEMTVMVVPTRHLPIQRVRQEYRHIIHKRLARVSKRGSREHAGGHHALETVLDMFREDQNAAWVRRGQVVKGTEIAFTRAGNGTLTARVNGDALGEVQSDALCRAVFDLYMGPSPVNAKAKKAAVQAAGEMLSDGRAPTPRPQWWRRVREGEPWFKVPAGNGS